MFSYTQSRLRDLSWITTDGIKDEVDYKYIYQTYTYHNIYIYHCANEALKKTSNNFISCRCP